MSLWNTSAYHLDAATTAESLPDPTTVPGRTHKLINSNTAPAVWSSVGATPFTENGANVTTITVPAGGCKDVQSNGVHWLVVPPSGQRQFYAGTAVTNASGDAVFTFPAGRFPTAPTVSAGIQFAAGSNPIDYRVTALSATSCTVNVRQSPTLVVLSLSVLGVAAPLAGATVHLHALEAG
jgi:hypothetical protein